MGAPHMRPPFRLPLSVPGADLLAEIEARLARGNSPFVGAVLRRHVELSIRPERRRFWSPHLSVDILEEEEGTILRGRYGPHPEVWTLVMAIFGVLIMVSLGSMVFGLSQWNLGWEPWALWGLPACALGAGTLWYAGIVGQRTAYPQMLQLEGFFHDCVRHVSEPPPP